MYFINNDLLLIFLIPFFVVLLFQLSSYLNMGILSTGIIFLETEDINMLTGIPPNRILMIPMKQEKVKFKILDENEKEETGEIIFDLDSLKIIESKNIEIDSEKLRELRRAKFSRVIRVAPERIKVSDDGNTFTEFESDGEGKEKIIGSVTFNDQNVTVEVTGRFKKFF